MPEVIILLLSCLQLSVIAIFQEAVIITQFSLFQNF